jgi:8-oxo-dGTP pyrophosphatase MutT (NUDIX family)
VEGDHGVLAGVLDGYVPSGAVEAADLARLRRTLERGAGVWSRSTPLHVTASALVAHPPSGRILLRWHERMGSWLQLGGHFDPGETDPLAVALREAREESGLADLRVAPATAGRPVHLAIVPVVPGGGEPAHEHADIRYLLVTDTPDAAVPESPTARLRWSPIGEAMDMVTEENLRVLLERAARLL